MPWNFHILPDFETGLAAAAELFASAGTHTHVFAHPALLRAWLDTYRPLRRLSPLFIAAEAPSGTRAILPLTLWHRNWKNAFTRSLIPIGYSDFDYHDPITSHPLSQEEKDTFWTELITFIQANISFDDFTTDGITEALLPSDTSEWHQGEICPMLHLDDIHGEDDMYKFLKTSLRGDIRRQFRRLSEVGPVAMKEFHSFEEIPAETLSTFLHQHTLRWPNAYKAPGFHENILRLGLDAGCVHFSTLMAGDTEVAWHLGFRHVGRYYYYMPAGHQDYLRYSPTKLHLFRLACRAAESGLQIFDHLRGEETYKEGWSNDARHVHSLTLQSATLPAALKRIFRQMKHRLPPPPHK